MLLCRCHRTWKEQKPVYLTKEVFLWHIQDEKPLFTQLMCISCFFQPLVTAKSNWIYTVSQKYNVVSHIFIPAALTNP